MYLLWKDGLASLQEPDNFRAFKLVIEAAPDCIADRARDLAGTVVFDGEDTAWVSQAALLALSSREGDPAWLQAFDAMLDKARPHGWVDASTGAIRAHVEWRRGFP